MDVFDFEGIPKGGVSFTADKENDPIVYDKSENSYRNLTSLRSESNRTPVSSIRPNKSSSRVINIKREERISSQYSETPRRTPSKQLSSTLKSNLYPPKRFEPNVSEIQQTSQRYEHDLSKNESTKIKNDLFKNIDLDNTTEKLSKNQNSGTVKRTENNVSKNEHSSTFDPSRCNEMYEKFGLDEDSKEIALKYCENINSPRPMARGTPTRGTNIKSPFLAPGEKPIETLVEQRSKLRPLISEKTNGPEIAVKPEPISHWGCVATGESVQSKVSIQNLTSNVLEITPMIKYESENDVTFRLTSNETLYIEPNGFEEIGIVFTPKGPKRYKQRLYLHVPSSGSQYFHRLFGYGGTANAEIVRKNCIKYFPRNSLYRCSPIDRSHFTFEVENKGDRSSFVHIVPYDEMGNESRQITVTPQSFCLTDASNPYPKQKITINVSDIYLQQMNRASLDSCGSSSSSSAAAKNCFLTLKVYFGDERIRQRATRYSEETNRHQTFRGLLLTKTPFFLNDNPLTALDKDPVSKQDIEMLKAQTRVLTVIVGDDRIGTSSLSLPSRPPSSSSHHTSSSADGYYFPQKDTGNESIISNVTNSNRTLY